MFFSDRSIQQLKLSFRNTITKTCKIPHIGLRIFYQNTRFPNRNSKLRNGRTPMSSQNRIWVRSIRSVSIIHSPTGVLRRIRNLTLLLYLIRNPFSIGRVFSVSKMQNMPEHTLRHILKPWSLFSPVKNPICSNRFYRLLSFRLALLRR